MKKPKHVDDVDLIEDPRVNTVNTVNKSNT